ncbi:hypothetical protein [Streptomyces sp. NPDC101234]|uniref:rhamnogalacturonan lyase family protein n=1 Tax=Streptomyces sp. NPDC101234 TaxID=3366138 RepID=UPI00382AF46F
MLPSGWKYGAVNASQGVDPTFVGDIMGDWREEAVYTDAAYDQLIIFTTDQPTSASTRLYTLARNPAYRNGMTFKGYMQSYAPDYFLGAGMSTPPGPNITYAPWGPARRATGASPTRGAVRCSGPRTRTGLSIRTLSGRTRPPGP